MKVSPSDSIINLRKTPGFANGKNTPKSSVKDILKQIEQQKKLDRTLESLKDISKSMHLFECKNNAQDYSFPHKEGLLTTCGAAEKDFEFLQKCDVADQKQTNMQKFEKVITPSGTFGGDKKVLSSLVTPGSDRNPYLKTTGWGCDNYQA